MPKSRPFIPRTVSARIILQTVTIITLLLAVTIFALTIGTRKIIREETERQVYQALDGITYRIDNTLLSVEQTAAIIKENIPNHPDNPQELFKLCRKAIEANPSIDGCAIALNPDYFTYRGKPFMAYVHRAQEELVSAGSFTATPFTEQNWYIKPLQEGVPSWTEPLKNEETETEPLISYVVPLVADGLAIGVLGVDISLSVLTQITQKYRTATNSYITLLGQDGSYIVHPDSTKLLHLDSLEDLKDAEDPAVMGAIQDMVSGKTGSKFFAKDSAPYYMAYTPFRQSPAPGRQIDSLGWSLAVIYPENDLFEEFDPGFRYAIISVIAGIILLLAGGIVITRISLKPLRKLTYITRIISGGNYKLPGFETHRSDEVGRLQSQYNQMLQAVSGHLEQLQQLSQKEAERQDKLEGTYARTKEIKKRSSAFFGNMSHQMADVTTEILDTVDKLNSSGGEREEQQMLESIEKNGVRVTEILNDLLNANN